MQVFISWSGERSRLVAGLLNEWLGNVMQHLETWYSPEMDRGSVWFNDIFNALANSSAGIICLTSENLNNPWILFESGAIAKGVTSNRVYTLTIDLEPEAIKPPLGQFNATKPTHDDMWKLVESINNFSEKDALDKDKLLRAFNAFWPDFEARFEEIISKTKSEATPSPRRSTDEMVSEILDIVRGLARDSAFSCNTINDLSIKNPTQRLYKKTICSDLKDSIIDRSTLDTHTLKDYVIPCTLETPLIADIVKGALDSVLLKTADLSKTPSSTQLSEIDPSEIDIDIENKHSK